MSRRDHLTATAHNRAEWRDEASSAPDGFWQQRVLALLDALDASGYQSHEDDGPACSMWCEPPRPSDLGWNCGHLESCPPRFRTGNDDD